MPLWDSVQRGLEKASQEASRMAKTQRLRSTIDTLSRQINTQSNNLVSKALELFTAGQLTQSELLPICQELVSLKQQINDAQNELKQLQASQPPTPSPTGQSEAPGTYPSLEESAAYPPTVPAGSMPYISTPVEGSYELPPTVYAPPPPGYQTYLDNAGDVTPPPPPPGVEPLTISAMETVMMSAGPGSASPAPQSEKRLCPSCGAEVQPDHAFCHNCGTPVQDSGSLHLPTMRASEPSKLGGDETVRADAIPPEYKPD